MEMLRVKWYAPPFGFASLFRLSATAMFQAGRGGQKHYAPSLDGIPELGAGMSELRTRFEYHWLAQ